MAFAARPLTLSLGLLVVLAVAAGLPPAAAQDASLEGLPDTIERIKPSIVGVATYQLRRRPPARFYGTGFVVGDGRHVLTNAHVVPDLVNLGKNEQLVIVLPGKEAAESRIRVKVVATDVQHDMALLALDDDEAPPLPPMHLAADDLPVREGAWFAFTGFPIGGVLGLTPVTHRALISAHTPIAVPAATSRSLTKERLRRLLDPYLVYQLDATAYPGNSGSPLYDAKTGAAVGVLNMVFVKGSKEDVLSAPSGIAYAIPIRHARALLTSAGVEEPAPPANRADDGE